jgi:hypothetical protein
MSLTALESRPANEAARRPGRVLIDEARIHRRWRWTVIALALVASGVVAVAAAAILGGAAGAGSNVSGRAQLTPAQLVLQAKAETSCRSLAAQLALGNEATQPFTASESFATTTGAMANWGDSQFGASEFNSYPPGEDVTACFIYGAFRSGGPPLPGSADASATSAVMVILPDGNVLTDAIGPVSVDTYAEPAIVGSAAARKLSSGRVYESTAARPTATRP